MGSLRTRSDLTVGSGLSILLRTLAPRSFFPR
jgi:hypothetical protein